MRHGHQTTRHTRLFPACDIFTRAAAVAVNLIPIGKPPLIVAGCTPTPTMAVASASGGVLLDRLVQLQVQDKRGHRQVGQFLHRRQLLAGSPMGVVRERGANIQRASSLCESHPPRLD